jgi:hypothetical protein
LPDFRKWVESRSVTQQNAIAHIELPICPLPWSKGNRKLKKMERLPDSAYYHGSWSYSTLGL